MNIITTDNLTKQYGSGETAVTALDQVNIQIASGEFVAVMGPSGCGKSTLLQLLGGLDAPTSGSILLEGTDLASLDDNALTLLRRQKIGFIFQFYNLLPVLTAGENVALPLILDGMKPADAYAKAKDWMTKVGVIDRWAHKPKEMSGGQQQRVAIARALVSDPAIILADEPTGNLDSTAADELLGVLDTISADFGRTILMVTHDPRMSAHAHRVINLQDGKVQHEHIVDTAPVMEALA